MDMDNDGQQQTEEYRAWLAEQDELEEWFKLIDQCNQAFDKIFGEQK